MDARCIASLEPRLAAKIEVTDGCWKWTASLRDGYGQYRDGASVRQAHRVVFERLVGDVPENLDLDHLCRNRACVNPAHLEIVTRKVNLLRGNGAPARNARKTSCVNGHPFDAENTGRRATGTRFCRTCVRAARLRHNARTAAT